MMTKKEIDKRCEEKHTEERKTAQAVWGTSMNRKEYDMLNKFFRGNGIKNVKLIYAGWQGWQGWQALQEQHNNKS